MPRVELAPEVADDFERILDHLAGHGVPDAAARLQDAGAALTVLESNPVIGRPAGAGKREPVIGRGARGYVALYRYVPEIDVVVVLDVRSRREAG